MMVHVDAVWSDLGEHCRCEARSRSNCQCDGPLRQATLGGLPPSRRTAPCSNYNVWRADVVRSIAAFVTT